MTTPLIETKDVSFAYEKKQILKNISLTINPGDRILLLGANGAGKSTLLRLLANLISPHQGKVNYFDTPERLSYLGHDLQLYLDLTVRENLEFFSSLWGGDSEGAMEFWSIKKYQRSAVKNLSQGQKKRVALAASYLISPTLALLDEPSTNLDVLGADLLKDRLSQTEAPEACVVASHDLRFFSDWCNRLFVIDNSLLSECKEIDPKTIQETYLKVLK